MKTKTYPNKTQQQQREQPKAEPVKVGQVRIISIEGAAMAFEVNIQTKPGKRVYITQHAEAGTSFQFVNSDADKEWHIPARMVDGFFC